MIIAFLSGISIPLAALGSAGILLITRRLKPERVFREIDWSLLVFFAGLFIVTMSIDTSGLGKYLSFTIQPYLTDSISSLALSSAFLSNIVSNVPAVLLLKPVVQSMGNPGNAWLVLGMSTTYAGNLTLIGSVANLIVAEAAQKHFIKITFYEYLKTGVIITIISLAIGILWFDLIF